MPVPEGQFGMCELRAEIQSLHDRIARTETRAEHAEQDAHQAREEVLKLRDEVAAAQRDQQDLRSAQAKLSRMQLRGIFARVVNRR